jgi:hypothetical protein
MGNSLCEGKAVFVSKSLADRRAHVIARRDSMKIASYYCRACRGFHVGSKVGNVRKREHEYD